MRTIDTINDGFNEITVLEACRIIVSDVGCFNISCDGCIFDDLTPNCQDISPELAKCFLLGFEQGGKK